MIEKDKKWIENLKIGDEVFIQRTFAENKIGKVTAINKATVKVDGTLFNKANGYIRGGGTWDCTQIKEITEESKAEIKLKGEITKLYERLVNLPIQKLSIEQVNKFNNFITELLKEI